MSKTNQMKDKIILAGGNGFIGKYFAQYFSDKGFQIVVLSRNPKKSTAAIQQIYWDGKNPGAWENSIEGAFAIINLAGKSVNCRYNDRNKKAILDSRIHSTAALGKAISRCENPPKIWLNSASATIYAHTLEAAANDEKNGIIGAGFSINVCQQWEKTFFSCTTPKTRKIALRSAITLGKDGGALVPMRWLTRLALGGRQGDGKQFVSWIHIEDLARITEWCFQHDQIEGILNCSAPYPLSNDLFMRTLRKVTGHVIGLPAPAWMLTIGAFLIGTEPELILKSRKVIPGRLLEHGFEFKFPKLERALLDLTCGWS